MPPCRALNSSCAAAFSAGSHVRDRHEASGDTACRVRESGGDEGGNALHGAVCAAVPSLPFFFF